MAGKLPLQAQEPLLVVGLDEFMHNRGGGGEAGFYASLACRHAQGDGDMGFADTAGAKRDDVLASIDKIRAGQIHNQFLVECGDRIEVQELPFVRSAQYGPSAMSERVLLVVHQKHSDPGRVARKLHDMGYVLDIRRPSGGDPLPATMDAHAGAVIFGGPMSANDNTDFIRAEIDWIPTVLASGKPFLGICLGGQLLTRALGGDVGTHPDGLCEVGYYPVQPTAVGAPLFRSITYMYQWHREGMDLPRGAERLASSERFENQAFRFGNAYAVQFHPEVTQKIMRRWTSGDSWKKRLGAQPPEEQFRGRRRHESSIVRWTRGFLETWIGNNAGTNAFRGIGRSIWP